MEQISLIKKFNSLNDVSKALQDLEKVVNGLLASTNTPAEGDVSDIDGKTGDIRITQNEDKDYIFEVRAEDGWKTPVIGDSAVKFKEKPSSSSKKQKKSIDELESTDTTTGSKEAEKTIFDEKAGKFVMARADCESGWLDADKDTSVVITHNLDLKTIPSMITVHASDVAAPVLGTDFITTQFHLNENWGYRLNIYSKDVLEVYIGSAGGLWYPGSGWFGGGTNADTGHSPNEFASGYIFVRIWK